MNNKFTGGIVLLKNVEIVCSQQIDFSDTEIKKKPNKKRKDRISSISKTFKATLVFKDVEEGKLGLNERIKNISQA